MRKISWMYRQSGGAVPFHTCGECESCQPVKQRKKGAIPVPGLREKTEGIGAVPGRQPGNRTRANAPERLDSLWECSWDCFLEALLGGL